MLKYLELLKLSLDFLKLSFVVKELRLQLFVLLPELFDDAVGVTVGVEQVVELPFEVVAFILISLLFAKLLFKLLRIKFVIKLVIQCITRVKHRDRKLRNTYLGLRFLQLLFQSLLIALQLFYLLQKLSAARV